MAIYNHREIEAKWRQYWKENKTFVVEKQPSDKPKYYVLDMFPYPSGSGLHVGHPLGYIATDITARYKRAKGYNVLHPMGFDAFGLPAEQYAIQKGVHPVLTTKENTERYWQQMERLGFCYDPECELRTSDASYYKWTQWIFLQLFKHYYCNDSQQARPISALEEVFVLEGNTKINAASTQKETFSAAQWQAFSDKEKHDILMNYRLAFQSFGYVNWCPALGTVLANDEVKEGKSERGGHPVERRKMPQWTLRITAYCERLLAGLQAVDFPESIKLAQANWIGRSEGGLVRYQLAGNSEQVLEIFTTRPDTIFGNTYMVIAPEHDLVAVLTTDAQKEEVKTYLAWAKNRSERERQVDTSKTGVFTGSFAIHPFTGKKLPIWISDYVLIGYGTGAIMAVPAHDERDYAFAKKFGLEIVEVICPPQPPQGGEIESSPQGGAGGGAYISKIGTIINSDFITGMSVKAAIATILVKIEEKGIGKRQITYKMRDVIWSRQRYWGEPTPIKVKNDMYYPVSEEELPIILPEMEDFKPTGQPESPLAKAKDWLTLSDGFVRETNTMPGAAGSSWYFLRYFDRDNTAHFSERKKADYWMPVDLYVGGAEHAVGHLLYSRFWTKFLKDLGEISCEEPYKKLVNQGMIQGTSALVYRHKETNEYWSADLVKNEGDFSTLYADVNYVKNSRLDISSFEKLYNETGSIFHKNTQGEFLTLSLVEKMSKSRYNTVSPDAISEEYGADTLRLYEMFLGPIEASKPWNTDGISGVVKFLKRVYNWFLDENEALKVSEEAATLAENKALHKLIKKVGEDIENLSFNTSVPAFMMFLAEIIDLKCQKRSIMQPFLSLFAPFAPHVCEELHEKMGGTSTILDIPFPILNETFLQEDSVKMAIQINGKVRAEMVLSVTATQTEVEALLQENNDILKWTEGKPFKKVVYVPKRIVNVVV